MRVWVTPLGTAEVLAKGEGTLEWAVQEGDDDRSLGVVAYILKRQVICILLPYQSQPIYNGKKNRKIIPFAKGDNR